MEDGNCVKIGFLTMRRSWVEVGVDWFGFFFIVTGESIFDFGI